MDSFLDFNPTVAVLLGAELEHVDYFKDMEQIRSSFLRYVSICPVDGYAVYNGDDDQTLRALAPFEGNRLAFSIASPFAGETAGIAQNGGLISLGPAFENFLPSESLRVMGAKVIPLAYISSTSS